MRIPRNRVIIEGENSGKDNQHRSFEAVSVRLGRRGQIGAPRNNQKEFGEERHCV
jgi:hypothetical protein